MYVEEHSLNYTSVYIFYLLNGWTDFYEVLRVGPLGSNKRFTHPRKGVNFAVFYGTQAFPQHFKGLVKGH